MTILQEPGIPAAVSSVIAIPTSIDYTSRDYTGLLGSMLIFANQAMPQWNPAASEGDMGVMLMELWAYVGDIMSYYIDRVGQEAYLPTATQRLSLLNIANLLGYQVSNGSPATGTVTFTTANPGAEVVIPLGTQVQSNFNTITDAPIIYQTTEQAVCPANGGTVIVPVSQGETFSLVTIGVSTGTAGQTFTLPETEVLDGSITVYVQNSSGGTNIWSQVNSFVDFGPSDMVFTSVTDANDNTDVTFGDGINGLIPGLNLTIYATFTTIVGTQGNGSAGSVNVLVSNIAGLSINQLATGIADSSEMEGGADPESNDSIRANAPTSFQTQQRAVSLDDFGALAMTVPGVSLANATANHSTSVALYVLGPSGSAPSTALQTNVLTYFNGPPQKYLAGVTLTTPTPQLIAVDLGNTSTYCTLVVQSTFNQQQVVNNVNNILNQILSPPSVQFGQLLQVSSFYQAIMAVAGVEYVVIPLMTREDVTQTGTNPIQFRQSEVPIPGNFYFNTTGGQ